MTASADQHDPVGIAGTDDSEKARLPWWRCRAPLAAAVVAVIAVAAVVTVVLGPRHSGRAPLATSGHGGATGDRSLTWQENIACSRYMVVGEVASVRAGSGKGRVTVILRVSQWVKPANGSRTIAFEVEDNTTGNAFLEAEVGHRPWTAGTHAYIKVPIARHEPPEALVGEHANDVLTRDKQELPEAADLTCPRWW